MTEALELYGLKRCSTCVKAMRWLDEHGIAYTFTDYRDQPIDPKLLSQWSQALGGWDKLANRASMTWRNLPPERKTPGSDAEWLALASEFPTLIKRPLMVRAGQVAALGFSEKKYSELIG